MEVARHVLKLYLGDQEEQTQGTLSQFSFRQVLGSLVIVQVAYCLLHKNVC